MKTRSISVLLAALLQALPLCRTVVSNPMVASWFAVVLRWVAGSAAALGAYDAYSAASAPYFTSPTNATGFVGQPFSFKFTVTNVPGDPGAIVAVATSTLPPGITNGPTVEITVSGHYILTETISGIPTTPTNNARLLAVASYPGQTSVTTNLYLTILGGSPPGITKQPAGLTNVAGAFGLLSVVAGGGTSLNYYWRHDTTNLPSATNASLTFTNLRLSNAGDYSVVVSNSVGAVTSAVAHVVVTVPPTPTLGGAAGTANGKFVFSFAPVVGLTNTVLTNSVATGGTWGVLTNIPPPANANPISITNPMVHGNVFFRVQFTP